jgi:UDP-N-acetylmuramoyl-L-alanyl-D-glutamate--2,6-diaminopimelate ligase|tara:strand:+ start:2852 stop:4303 length:1452 start_codon:yes stop_codon:yes gene_type:complete
MTGEELLAGLPHQHLQGALDFHCGSIAYDSRRVTPRSIFVALEGDRTDGHDHIQDAAQRGASMVIVERSVMVSTEVAVVQVLDSRHALAVLAATFFGQPAQSLKLIGITGTNGKTSVAFLLRHLLRCAGRSCGLIGTVEYDLGDRIIPASRTTPESLELHQYLAGMVQSGCEFCIMEVSSHALQQHRVAGLKFSGTVFTNLTQDHLDYHGDMEKYFATKRCLFEMRTDKATQIVNMDDPFGRRMVGEFDVRTFGEAEEATFRISDLTLEQLKTSFQIAGAHYSMPLIGRHNVSNAAAAIGLARGIGISVERCIEGLSTAEPVPGRLEPIYRGQPFAVYVDYAHTDDALRQVLLTLREITPGRLHVIFGCGGNRDIGKRFKMGVVAAELADKICITTDNPRNEKPELIAGQIAEGCASVSESGWWIELDRERAIDEIIRAANPGDTVLIAGKGHETYQEIEGVVIPFDDREMARTVLSAIEAAH